MQTYSDIQSPAHLASGCNGAVFSARAKGIFVALKVMFNYGLETSAATSQQGDEYKFLQTVPPHPNIVAFYGVISPSPLTEELANLLPEETRRLVQNENVRNGNKKYRPTTGLLLEYIPCTLEKFVKDQRELLTPSLAITLGTDIVCAAKQLNNCGVVHGDKKPNNIMVDVTGRHGQPRAVLVDFGCAVVKGDGPKDMDDRMAMRASAQNPVSFGNIVHLAPEVRQALSLQCHADGNQEVIIPLRQQGAFSAGLLLFELAMGLQHPLPNYAADYSFAAFADIDFEELATFAGAAYTEVVKGLLQYDRKRRMTLSTAHDKLQRIR